MTWIFGAMVVGIVTAWSAFCTLYGFALGQLAG